MHITPEDHCKIFGHQWDELGFAPVNVTILGDEDFWRCVSCGSIQVKVFNSWGHVTYRRYIYSQGYKKALANTRLEVRAEYARSHKQRAKERKSDGNTTRSA